MSKRVATGFGSVLIVGLVVIVIWIISPDSFQSSGVGAICGMVGGVLGVTFMQRYKDERFTQITNLSSRNVFLFIMIALPLSGAFIILTEVVTVLQAAGMVFLLWISSLAIYGASLLYYYKR
ncbi:MAG: hypothetical protein ACW98Y_20740 [Candidatus Thorarchaeota archaeon]